MSAAPEEKNELVFMIKFAKCPYKHAKSTYQPVWDMSC